jgi:hypothetical protein
VSGGVTPADVATPLVAPEARRGNARAVVRTL